jgi:hypothetical protein
MATRSTVPYPRSKSAVITTRLRAHRSPISRPTLAAVIPFPAPLDDFVQSLHWRSRVHLFVLQLLQSLLPEPGPDDDMQSEPDGC